MWCRIIGALSPYKYGLHFTVEQQTTWIILPFFMNWNNCSTNWQLRQRPSATLNGITTRSPFLRRETPEPVSRTMPMFSWPCFHINSFYSYSSHISRDLGLGGDYRNTTLLARQCVLDTCANPSHRSRRWLRWSVHHRDARVLGGAALRWILWRVLFSRLPN